MKAAPFAYVRPGSVAEAVDELGREGAKVIAGGQSLVPVLAMRLGRPATLVDVNAVPELGEVAAGEGTLRVGATVRQRQLQHDGAASAVPLLRLALPWVGHREIRSRGTVCGSLAHADPAAELPAVACCLEATLGAVGSQGRRELSAEDFFAGALTTSLRPDELLTDVTFPAAADGEGFGFAELARRHGDFALAGVAARVYTSGAPLQARVTGFGVSDVPVSRDCSELLRDAVDRADGDAEALERTLAERTPDVAADLVDTVGDAHASPAYRRQVVGVLLARVLARAHRDARTRTAPEGPR